MRILSEKDVERLIEPLDAIETAIDAYRFQAEGRGSQIGRLDVRRPEPKSGTLVLAGFFADELVVKTNVHSYTGGERRAGSLLVVWDTVTCKPKALISAFSFNNHRTAAGFAAAARILAPARARTLTLFGAGKIAPMTARYLAAVRPIDRILIVGRRLDRARKLVDELRSAPDLAGVDLAVAEDPVAAVKSSDIIATVTTSDRPVFSGDAVQPGALVILGGANRPDAREADDALCARAQIVVDHLAGSMERAGDIKIPLESGALARHQIVGEIGAIANPSDAVVLGKDVTVFKSIGIASQDVALAQWLIEKAQRQGLGVEIDIDDGSVCPTSIASKTEMSQRVKIAGEGAT